MKKVLTGSLIILLFGALATGCNTSDYAKDDDALYEPATTTSNDTSLSMPTNTNATDSKVDVTPNEISKDSTATASPAAGASTATPNAEKKGKKGVVVINTERKSAGDEEAIDKEGYYTNIYPAYPGGDKALVNFFQKNIQYPADASDNGVEGTVNLSFTVDENGKVGKPQIVGSSLGYGLEQEALRVFNKMPVWKPGALKGRNVKTRFTLPVTFTLE